MRQDEHRRIKIGLLLGGLTVPAWTARLVELLLASEDAEPRLAILAPPPTPSNNGAATANGAVTAGPATSRNHALVDFYLDFEEQYFSPRPDAFRPVDLAPLLAGVMMMELPPAAALDALDAAADRVARLELDVLIDLSGPGREPHGRILQSARCGLWRLVHGEPRTAQNNGVPPGLAEVFQRAPVTGAALQLLGATPEESVTLLRTWSATDPRSVRHNRHHLYWKSLHLAPRALRELRRLGPTRFMVQARQADAEVRFSLSRRRAISSSLRFVRPLLGRLWSQGVQRLTGRFRAVQTLLLVAADAAAPELDMRQYRRLVPPPDRLWRDPFVFFKDGRYSIFFSENRLLDDRRHIAVITQHDDGSWSDPAVALERPHNLAYPFIFKWDGAIYMIPSSPEIRAVELYRCAEWPGQWEFVRNLISGAWVAHATIHPHRGKWWLFLNVKAADEVAACDELHLFYADSPMSDRWTPHPRNPVVANARHARPAGRLFESGNALYRPARAAEPFGDSSIPSMMSMPSMSSITINRILKLNEESYEEVAVETLAPGWDPAVQGLRTLNFTGRMTVLEVVRRTWTLFRGNTERS